MERRAFLASDQIEDRPLRSHDVYPIIAFGAFFGAALALALFLWAASNDELCVNVGSGRRCVVFEDR